MTLRDKLPISLVVITHNEERTLKRCLDAANFCADTVVVDSGSTDRTVEIASQHGARILYRPWSGYIQQKNFACQQAEQPWVLCLDADEVVSPELGAAIRAAFFEEPVADGFELNRHSLYGNKLISHSGWYPQWRLFLFRRKCAHWGGREPHAEVLFLGKTKTRLSGDLYHYTYSDIRHQVTKNVAFAYESALAMHQQGRRAGVGAMLVRPAWAVFRSYVLRRGFLSGFYGIVIAVVAGFYTFLKYAMLCEMRIGNDTKRGQSE